jgi:IS30 family transposase
MANQLKVAVVHAIVGLLELRWPYRRIARELGVHRETVACYDRLRQVADAKPANPPPGSGNREAPGCSLCPPSLCQPFAKTIKQKLDQGLSGQRIWQDLVAEHGSRFLFVGQTV